MTKRILSLFLAMLMVLSMVPAEAFAEPEETEPTEEIVMTEPVTEPEETEPVTEPEQTEPPAQTPEPAAEPEPIGEPELPESAALSEEEQPSEPELVSTITSVSWTDGLDVLRVNYDLDPPERYYGIGYCVKSASGERIFSTVNGLYDQTPGSHSIDTVVSKIREYVTEYGMDYSIQMLIWSSSTSSQEVGSPIAFSLKPLSSALPALEIGENTVRIGASRLYPFTVPYSGLFHFKLNTPGMDGTYLKFYENEQLVDSNSGYDYHEQDFMVAKSLKKGQQLFLAVERLYDDGMELTLTISGLDEYAAQSGVNGASWGYRDRLNVNYRLCPPKDLRRIRFELRYINTVSLVHEVEWNGGEEGVYHTEIDCTQLRDRVRYNGYAYDLVMILETGQNGESLVSSSLVQLDPTEEVGLGSGMLWVYSGGESRVLFRAPENGVYVFESTGGDAGTCGNLYDGWKNWLKTDYDSGEGHNFRIEQSMGKDELAYLGIRLLGSSQSRGVSFSISRKIVSGINKVSWAMGRDLLNVDYDVEMPADLERIGCTVRNAETGDLVMEIQEGLEVTATGRYNSTVDLHALRQYAAEQGVDYTIQLKFWTDYGYGWNVGDKIPLTLPELHHDVKIRHEAADATCTEPGNLEYIECVDCGVYYDAAGNEIAENSWVIPALGHTERTDEAVEPTCVEPGRTEGSHCTVCGEVLKPQEEIPALGHDFSVFIDDEAHYVPGTGLDCQHCKEYYMECSRCGQLSDVPVAGEQTGDHCFSEEWSSMDGSHWHACTVEGCTEKVDLETCYGGSRDCSVPSICAVCGVGYAAERDHDYIYCFDSVGHWLECRICHYKGSSREDHDFVYESDERTHYLVCAVCRMTGDIPHFHVPDRPEPTPSEPVVCTICGYEITPAGGYITVTAPELKLSAGKSMQLKAAYYPRNLTNAQTIWHLDGEDNDYAVISASGKLTVKKTITKAHKITVWASPSDYNARSGSVEIWVYPMATQVVIDQGKTISINVNRQTELELTAEVLSREANPNMAWSTTLKPENGSLVRQTGRSNILKGLKLTKEKPVTFKVTAKAVDGSGKYAVINVKLYAAPNPGDLTIAGSSYQMGGTSRACKVTAPMLLTDKKVTWSLRPEDAQFASVTASGKLTAKKVDSAVQVVLTATGVTDPEVIARKAITITPKTTRVELTMNGTPVSGTKTSIDLTDSMSVQLGRSFWPADASPEGTWKSANPKIATVDSTGMVTFLSNGTCKITYTASDGSKAASSVTLVGGARVTYVNISGASRMTAGQKQKLTAAVNPSATNKKLNWSCYPQNIVSVASDGTVTAAKGLGYTAELTVRAAAADGSGVYGEHQITVLPAASSVELRLSGSSESVNGKTLSFYIVETKSCRLISTVRPSGASGTVKWSSSAASVASVDANGYVTFNKAGTVTITAAAADGSGTKGSCRLVIKSGTVKDGIGKEIKAGLKISMIVPSARVANYVDVVYRNNTNYEIEIPSLIRVKQPDNPNVVSRYCYGPTFVKLAPGQSYRATYWTASSAPYPVNLTLKSTYKAEATVHAKGYSYFCTFGTSGTISKIS